MLTINFKNAIWANLPKHPGPHLVNKLPACHLWFKEIKQRVIEIIPENDLMVEFFGLFTSLYVTLKMHLSYTLPKQTAKMVQA